MIQTKIAEINVSELMERVRAKADEIRRIKARPQLPTMATPKEVARAILPHPVAAKTEQILDSARRARSAMAVPRWIPKPLRRFFGRQSTFNHEIIRAIEWLASTNAQLGDRLRHLGECVQVQDHGIHYLVDLRRQDGDWMTKVSDVLIAAYDRLAEAREELRNELASKSTTITSLEQRIELYKTESAAVAQHLERIEGENVLTQRAIAALRSDLDAAAEHHRRFAEEELRQGRAEFTDIVALTRADMKAMGEQLQNVQARADTTLDDVSAYREELNQASEHLRNLQSQVDRLAQLEQRVTDDGTFLKGELASQRTVMGQLLGSHQDRSISRKTKTPLPRVAGNLDAFYLSFEDRFRGSRAEIKNRLRFYISVVEENKAGATDRPILDVGCGRGEWLELAAEQHLAARGVDVNAMMCAQSVERGLDVVHADAIDYLAQQKDRSFGAITGFHIIEHLALETLLELFRQAYRVLKPGGLVIFESPNCKNLVVGASYFNIDPTHRNPIFPETAEFMLTVHGFEKVQVHYLSPRTGSPFTSKSAESKFFNDHLFGPQDFSVVGFKPAAR